MLAVSLLAAVFFLEACLQELGRCLQELGRCRRALAAAERDRDEALARAAEAQAKFRGLVMERARAAHLHGGPHRHVN